MTPPPSSAVPDWRRHLVRRVLTLGLLAVRVQNSLALPAGSRPAVGLAAHQALLRQAGERLHRGCDLGEPRDLVGRKRGGRHHRQDAQGPALLRPEGGDQL
jgi:hypothetical protein